MTKRPFPATVLAEMASTALEAAAANTSHERPWLVVHLVSELARHGRDADALQLLRSVEHCLVDLHVEVGSHVARVERKIAPFVALAERAGDTPLAKRLRDEVLLHFGRSTAMGNDLSTSILREIRDGIHATNARLDQTNARLDQTNVRMEEGFEQLSRRLVESEMRTATAIVELAGSVRDVTEFLRSQHDLRPRVEKCEAEIGQLKKRLRPRPA